MVIYIHAPEGGREYAHTCAVSTQSHTVEEGRGGNDGEETELSSSSPRGRCHRSSGNPLVSVVSSGHEHVPQSDQHLAHPATMETRLYKLS